jgi:lysylphosphatidylglycerol synthetase-like protein (DUF2156 family)
MSDMTDNKSRLALARPKDRSLEAYKTWIQNMVRAMGGPTGDATDDDWRELHAEFWANADKAGQ